MSVRLTSPRIRRWVRIPTTVLVSVLAACAPASGVPSASPSVEASVAASASVAPSASSTDDTSSGEPFAVTVNGLRIVGHCSGSRAGDLPVVVLQSGNGASDRHLAGIEDHLADRTMVCAWSRPGAGDSDAPPEPRPVSEVVAEVRDVLGAIEVEPPYFLIGQSAGAVVTIMFAQAYPTEVAGFVFMNGNPPFDTWVAAAEAAGLPQGAVDGAVADFSGANPEQIDFRSNDSMLSTPLPGSMPYAVIYDECGGQPGCDDSWEAAVMEQVAAVGDRGRFVRAVGAGHEVHVTQPELVNEVIDEVWADATD